MEDTPPVDITTLAEPPHWPVGMLLSDELYEAVRNKKKNRRRRTERAEILLWVPPGAARVRSVLWIAQNTDSKHVGEHAPVREVAVRHGMAIMYTRMAFHWILADGPGKGYSPRLMQYVARATGRREFAHVPWITFGKSSMGLHPVNHAWAYPRRTIACITYHGQTPNWPLPEWARGDGTRAADETILYAAINGHTEWMGTWYRHVRPMHLNYRANTRWLTHQVVLRGVGHGNYADVHGSPGWGKPVPEGAISCLRVWDYIAVFIDKALSLRVPPDADPRAGPVPLRRVDPGTGFYVHPRAVEVIPGFRWRPIRREGERYVIVDHVKEPHEVYDPDPGELDPARMILPAAEVPAGERTGMFWLADREQVDAWLGLHQPRR